MKKKRAIIAAVAAVAVLGIGGTIAYNQDRMVFDNIFNLGDDVIEYTEHFESPSNWQPCQEVAKDVIATNKNETPRYVRMKIDKYWRTSNTTTPASDHATTDLPLTWTDSGGVEHEYAIINMQNTNDWIYRDGWYYYKNAINKNVSTNSLLESVTLNCDANFASQVTYSADGKTGQTVLSDYSGATFHVYVTVQTSTERYLND